MYDIAILGAGPAGLSAAINARVRNKSVAVIGGDYRENPLYRSSCVPNYPGLPDVSGRDLLERLHGQAEKLGAEFIQKRLISAMQMGDIWYLSAEDEVVEARVLILAGGVARSDKFAGEEAFLGRGVSYCATCDGMLYRQKHVVVYGETETSELEANYLKEIGCIVIYLSRRPAHGRLVDTIPFIRIKSLEIGGEGKVDHVRVDGERVLCEGVFVLRAAVAPIDLLPTLAVENGHIRVDEQMRTNLPGVFAAGDCVGKPYQLAKAVGQGQVAALAAVDVLG
jgi:thioredoxin reductase (NADPH)